MDKVKVSVRNYVRNYYFIHTYAKKVIVSDSVLKDALVLLFKIHRFSGVYNKTHGNDENKMLYNKVGPIARKPVIVACD